MTGFINFQNRYYDPTIEKWTTEDPTGPAGSGANLYEAEGDSPTSRVDPTGLISVPGGMHFSSIINDEVDAVQWYTNGHGQNATMGPVLLQEISQLPAFQQMSHRVNKESMVSVTGGLNCCDDSVTKTINGSGSFLTDLGYTNNPSLYVLIGHSLGYSYTSVVTANKISDSGDGHCLFDVSVSTTFTITKFYTFKNPDGSQKQPWFFVGGTAYTMTGTLDTSDDETVYI
jgi:uncharacterized protein RhaS with RHS repeats